MTTSDKNLSHFSEFKLNSDFEKFKGKIGLKISGNNITLKMPTSAA